MTVEASKICGAVVAVALGASPVAADVSSFCTKPAAGPATLGFDVRPSMVVNAPAVLDVTRGDLGLGGTAGERAFSFSRTVAAILDSAGAPSDAAAQQAFVQTMLDGFSAPTGKRLNAAAGIMMPFDDRPQEAALSAAALLDEASDDALIPLALFNRFDLAPADWSHCGEHRIVYGKNRPDTTSPFGRFLLIFEAMVQNPSPADGERGCRRVTEFWAGLTGKSDADQATALSGFYYDGVTGHADGNLTDPVVHFGNLGGDGTRGQVRANAFIQPEWQLREWLTQLTFAASGPALAFVPVTVKGNPLAQLFHDDITADADVMAGNVATAVEALHGQFIQSLTAEIVPNLMSEGGAKHQMLTAGLADFDLGAAPVTEEGVLVNTIGLGNADKFNEHQSTSQGDVDVPGAAGSAMVTALLDAAGQSSGTAIPGQSGQTILNRARAVTCGGCHMTAARSNPGHFTGLGVVIRENADSTVVRWPDVHSGGFVHVNEPDRALSAALEDQFLPFRRYLMGRHLCADLQPATTPATPTPTGEPSDPYALVLADQGVDASQVQTSTRYVDAVVGAFVGAGGDTAGLADRSRSAMTSDLSEAQREGLRSTVARTIDAARAIELRTPGAYVETRRPH